MRAFVLPRYLLGCALGVFAIALGIIAAAAFAHPTSLFIAHRTSIRVHGEVVLGHHVRVCSWRPGDPRVRGRVRYSPRLMTVPGWAGAGQRSSRAVCAINGGTYRLSDYLPSGTVYAGGRRVRGVTDAPAVGFLSGGRVVWGAQTARRAGSGNIINGLAYLVSGGKPLLSHSDAPWTTSAQFSCGAPGTDGYYGCSRSVLAQFANGRVGLVEIGHASMPLAARILVRMGAREAITFDSGGAALLWTLEGRRNTTGHQVGRLFGVTAGTPWHRRIPDAIVINARRVA